MTTPTYLTINSSNPTQKKHQHIKSQQQLTPTYTTTSYHKRLSQLNLHQYNNNYPTTNTYLIQIINNSQNNANAKSIKMLIPQKTKLQKLKNILCERIKQNQDQIYFYTVNPHVDYNFDYCLEEGIGVIYRDCKLGYITKEIQKDSLGNVLQGSTIADYHIYNCLSVGGFSKVFLTRSKKTGKFYAAKFIYKNFDKSIKFHQLIHNEKYINQLLDYPLLVKMYKFIQSKQFYIFILDYCPAGELFTLMKLHREMRQDQAKFYFIQTILAIDYMHQNNIIYRDIKPENILLDKDGHIKIADFGLAKILREKRTMSYCGSLEYMAPEIVLGNQYSFGVDYYCLGSLLFQLMIGFPPYYNPNYTPSQTKYHIANSELSFPNVKHLSHQFVDFVRRLLDKNPKKRLGSIGGIKQILLHPWVGKFQREKYQKKQIKPPYINSLNQSNFQTEYLPLEAIKQIKMKINLEIQQISKQRGYFQKKNKNLNTLKLSSKQIIKSTQKPNQNCAIPSTLSINKRKVSNPYSTIKPKKTNKQKLLCYLQKNLFQKSTKSLHSSKNQSKTKKRLFTANLKHQSQKYSTINSPKYQNTPKDNQKLYKYFEKQKFEKIRTQNNTLHRKSGTHQQQNDFKTKFDNKAKETKKIYGNYLRNSQIQQWNKDKNNSNKKVAYNINQALMHSLQR